MSDSNLPQDTLICKPTTWFLWRVLAMLVMFSVFAVLFLKDGIWGYRDKNLHFFMHHTFVEAGKAFQAKQSDGLLTEDSWKTYAASQTCFFPENGAEILPKDVDLAMPWPDALVDGYSLMKDKGGQNGANKLWEDYTAARGWDAEAAEEPMQANKITEQFVAAAVAFALILGTLFILFRTMRRTIKADHDALYTQDGRKILYSDMVRIDKRKWDTKGIALVYYSDQGEEKKAKIDGMVYGQFKEEDGAPAEKLFSRVMEHFKGEVLEYVDDEDDEAEDQEDLVEADKTS
ncbi:hypothetical protein HW115_03015 [Verrucomicrobiaceae bacterium N1E253]|uniref:Uncharacterized protein n=1 Tax=Oceaniferula marina TaxID=2748318 RepID=A0A851GAX6_9BACT|nr:hypothetical protein [Oceaniferula marina]NWK54566.1 hypothetical protein [Oceaniferula marina]